MTKLHGIDRYLLLPRVVLDVRRHEPLREEEHGDPDDVGRACVRNCRETAAALSRDVETLS